MVPLNPTALEDHVLAYGWEFVRDRLHAEAELAADKTYALDDVLAELDD